MYNKMLSGGANRWTNWVKEFASKNNLSYGCALSTPACKTEYRAKYGLKLTKKEQKENEKMGAEEATGKINKTKRHKEKVVELKSKLNKNIALKGAVEKGKELQERNEMGAEDINRATKKIRVKKPKQKQNIQLIIEEDEPVAPVAPVAPKKRGRPKKYETAEEARQMKIQKTIEASKRRQVKKREDKANKKKPKLIIEEDGEEDLFGELMRLSSAKGEKDKIERDAKIAEIRGKESDDEPKKDIDDLMKNLYFRVRHLVDGFPEWWNQETYDEPTEEPLDIRRAIKKVFKYEPTNEEYKDIVFDYNDKDVLASLWDFKNINGWLRTQTIKLYNEGVRPIKFSRDKARLREEFWAEIRGKESDDDQEQMGREDINRAEPFPQWFKARIVPNSSLITDVRNYREKYPELNAELDEIVKDRGEDASTSDYIDAILTIYRRLQVPTSKLRYIIKDESGNRFYMNNRDKPDRVFTVTEESAIRSYGHSETGNMSRFFGLLSSELADKMKIPSGKRRDNWTGEKRRELERIYNNRGFGALLHATQSVNESFWDGGKEFVLRPAKYNKYNKYDDEDEETGRGFNPLPDYQQQVTSAEGGHWTNSMTPHLEKEMLNYVNIAHHLGQHLNEKGVKDPKDITGFHHFSREAERVKKLLNSVKTGGDFFSNIGNAFKTTWNKKPASNAEKGALNFFYNDFLPVATKVLPPPVATVADVGFDALKKHQGV